MISVGAACGTALRPAAGFANALDTLGVRCSAALRALNGPALVLKPDFRTGINQAAPAQLAQNRPAPAQLAIGRGDFRAQMFRPQGPQRGIGRISDAEFFLRTFHAAPAQILRAQPVGLSWRLMILAMGTRRPVGGI